MAPCTLAMKTSASRRDDARATLDDESAERVVDLAGAAGDADALKNFSRRVETRVDRSLAVDDGDRVSRIEAVAADARTDNDDAAFFTSRSRDCALLNGFASRCIGCRAIGLRIPLVGRSLARVAIRIDRIRCLRVRRRRNCDRCEARRRQKRIGK